MKRKLSKKKIYTFKRSGWDIVDSNPYHPIDGTKVMITQPYGCPTNGTMGHTYIMDATTKEFYGLCSINSLM